MSNTKKEHYVPRCYLKNFTFKNGRINVFDKSNATVRENQNIFDVAMENYFYDIDLVKEITSLPYDSQEKIYTDLSHILRANDKESINDELSSYTKLLEDKFANLESNYGVLLDKIKKISNRKYFKNHFGISNRLKNIFSKYIAIQILRTKDTREKIRDLYEKLNKELVFREFKRMGYDINREEIDVESKKVFIKLQHILMIMDDENIKCFSNVFKSHIWVFYINKTNIPFYTSDSPIVTIPHISDKYISYSGIKSKGVEVVFPINSELLLAMYEKSYHSKEYKDRKFVNLYNVEKVNIYNSFQVLSCHRTVFSKNNDFKMALDLCKYNPQIMDISNKIIVNEN